MRDDRPNILMIMADQLAAPAIGCYGNPTAQTPHMDRLAEEGVLFEHCYCNSPICAPSRASMCSGRLPARLDHYDNGTEFPAHISTFLHHLRNGGYETVLSGKMHFVGPDQYHGFERRLTTDIYPSAFGWTKDWSKPVNPALGMIGHLKQAGPRSWTEQLEYDEEVHFRALEQLRSWCGQGYGEPPDRPWFLCASYTHPHDPPYITSEYWDLYDENAIDMPAPNPHPNQPLHPVDRWLMAYLGLDQMEMTEEDVRRSRLGYYAMTSYFDHLVGDLVSTLEAQGLAENTIIIVTSDHDDMVGEHDMWFKRTFYEWSARVPWIVSWPGNYPGGRRVSQTVSLVDLFPTLLDMAGLPAAEGIDGDSTTSLMTGDDPAWKDEAIIDFTSAGSLHPWRAVRQGRYKYVNVYNEAPLLFDRARSHFYGFRQKRLNSAFQAPILSKIGVSKAQNGHSRHPTRRNRFDSTQTVNLGMRPFDLETDPDEWFNLAGLPELAEIEDRLRRRTEEDWDPAEIEAGELRRQQERLFIQAAHGQGAAFSWDCQPYFDASQQYTR